jgi:hypothetical protein
MGGNFSALGDPMQLMFKARNDFGAFAKDIGKASAEFVTMNKETGEFSSNSGLAKDRMREISRITGIAVDELHNMAEAEAKMQEVRKRGNPFISEEDMELVSSFAKFSEENKDFVVNIDGKDKLVKDLREIDLKKIREDNKTLQERANDSRTFDETLQDLILTLKQQLLPFAKILKENFGDRIKELGEWFATSEFKELLNGLFDKIQGFAKTLGDWIKDNPITTGFVVGTTLFGGVLMDAAKWVLNGVALGIGFNKIASVGGGNPINNLTGGSFGKFGKTSGGTSFGKSLGKGLKTSAGLGIASLGFDIGRSFLDDENSGFGKALGVGSAATEYGAYGAMLGSVIPGIGNVAGALIGGAIGLGKGVYDEYIRDDVSSQAYRGGSSGFVRANDGIMFHPNDKFMQVNDAVTIAGTSTSGNNKLVQELKGTNTSGEINHSFKDLNIKISVDAPTDSEFWRSVVNQPDIMRRITEAVHISTEEAASGKLTGKAKRRS